MFVCDTVCEKRLETQNPEFYTDGHVARLSLAGEIAGVISDVIRVMAEVGYHQKDIFGIRMAMEEALANSIKHGHQNDSTKEVTVRYKVCADYVLLEITDEGPGFDPANVPDPTMPENLERPCGRGLLLINTYTSWVRYSQRGNCVTFCKYPSMPIESASAAAPTMPLA